ncbi:MAG: helix-turn-helix domain-containing protein [Acidobacteriota bacterium]
MESDARIADAVQLLADRSRVSMLWALAAGEPLPASELARVADIRPSTASAHLTRLVDVGWVSIEKRGRHRLVRLIRPEVIQAMEGLARIAPSGPARTFREGRIAAKVREARTCYDHLAGRRAIEVVRALERRRYLLRRGDDFELSTSGARFFVDLGIDVEAARRRRRSFSRACLDWSEREHHLAGALGAALLDRMFERRWIERIDSSRAVMFTPSGRRALHGVFGIEDGEG